MISLLPDIWPYLAGFATLIGGALGLYLKGRRDGAAKVRAKADQDRIVTMKEAHRARAKAEALDDEELARSITRRP
jgi:hypothetical protein